MAPLLKIAKRFQKKNVKQSMKNNVKRFQKNFVKIKRLQNASLLNKKNAEEYQQEHVIRSPLLSLIGKCYKLNFALP